MPATSSLPSIMLLAAAALTGTVVRRITGSSSRGAFLVGFLACLFLAPVPLIAGPHFQLVGGRADLRHPRYGLAAVAALFALYGLAVLGARSPTWALAVFAGGAAALIVPAHIVIALLGVVGRSVWTIGSRSRSLDTRRLPVSVVWRRTFIATARHRGHRRMGTSDRSTARSAASIAQRSALQHVWQKSVAIVASALGVPGHRGRLVPRPEPGVDRADLYVGTGAIVVTAAVVLGGSRQISSRSTCSSQRSPFSLRRAASRSGRSGSDCAAGRRRLAVAFLCRVAPSWKSA